uniref:Uncharacterized protein n=1 Tax=Triticum urartu TaxID=4572 RepID=A0A8R7P0W0_TRIUA
MWNSSGSASSGRSTYTMCTAASCAAGACCSGSAAMAIWAADAAAAAAARKRRASRGLRRWRGDSVFIAVEWIGRWLNNDRAAVCATCPPASASPRALGLSCLRREVSFVHLASSEVFFGEGSSSLCLSIRGF